MSFEQDLAVLKGYWDWETSKVPLETVQTVIDYKQLQNGGSSSNTGEQTNSYTNPNFSGTIAAANTPQDLAAADPNRDRLTIQNLDETESLLYKIGEDAAVGSSFELLKGGIAYLDAGEADKRISVLSGKQGLAFVAIGRTLDAN